MKPVQLDYQGSIIHADRDAWFNATEVAALFGKKPIEWLRLPETKRYIEALIRRERAKQAESEVGKSHFTKAHLIKTRRGNTKHFQQGTWLHPKLAVAFARWLDIDFSIWCDEQIEQLLTERPQWQSARLETKSSNRTMNMAIHLRKQIEGKEAKHYHFSNEALMLNECLTGRREALDRDTLPKPALSMLNRLEITNNAHIAMGTSYEERKAMLWEIAAPVRAQFYRFETEKLEACA